MARLEARCRHDYTRMMVLLCLMASVLLQHGASGQRVKVEEKVWSHPGQTVTLHCGLTKATADKIHMVSWSYESKHTDKIFIVVYHPNFEVFYPNSTVKGRVSFTHSAPKLDSSSIQIRNVSVADEGKYICALALPFGTEEGITYLVVLDPSPPQNSVSVITVKAGTEPVVVARCVSADGRPAAQISWVTTVNGTATTESKQGDNNTVTVSSAYWLVPTAADKGKNISCVVAHSTQVNPDTFFMKLAIQYAPQVTIQGYDNNWYLGRKNVVLTCQFNGYPIPFSILWKTTSGVMPSTALVYANELRILTVDEAANTTFICEVANRIGIGRDQVTVLVRGLGGQP